MPVETGEKKTVQMVFSGPSSYASGGFVRTISELTTLDNIVSVDVDDDTYLAGTGMAGGITGLKVTEGGTEPNQINIEVSGLPTQAGTPAWTEVGDGVDLSNLNFIVTAEGW